MITLKVQDTKMNHQKYRLNTIKNRGFTLLEIMIVIVIIGILLTIVAQNLVNKPDQARLVKAKTDIRSIESALILYKAEISRFPTTEQGLNALLVKPQDLPLGAKWNGPYLSGNKITKDPWGKDYVYLSPGEHVKAYDLYSLGADGQVGGEDADADIGNWNIDN